MSAAKAGESGFDLTLQRAIELHEAGGYEAAIQIYQSLREDRPEDAHLLFELARSSLAVKDVPACVAYAGQSAARSSPYQPAAFAVLAKCQLESGMTAAALGTYASGLERYPADPSLHFDFALALQAKGEALAADTEFSRALQNAATQPSLYLAYGNRVGARSNAGALLMNLRYIMAAPQSPLAAGAAEQILALLDLEPNANPAAPGDAFDVAFANAKEASNAAGSGRATQAKRLSELLQRFVLNVVDAATPELVGSPLWGSAMEPMLSMAENDVLDTYLYFVAALARTDGSPEWLTAHRQEFERLVAYLARVDTPS